MSRPRPGDARRRVCPRLPLRQLDDTGSRVLVGKLNALGVQMHLNKNPREILGNGSCAADAGHARPKEGLPGRKSRGYDPFKVGLFEDPV